MRLTAILRVRSWSPVDLALVAGAMTLAAATGSRLAVARDSRAPIPPAVEPRNPAVAFPPDAAPQPTPAEELALTVSLAPFSPDRAPPAVRYRPELTPQGGAGSTRAREEDRIPAFRVRGTATDGDTRLALIEGAPAEPQPRLYRPGERLDRFVLKTVHADSAVLESADTTLVLRIVRPWQSNAP